MRDSAIKDVFKSDEEYFTLMRSFHERHGAKAIPEVLYALVAQELRALKQGKVVDAGCGEGSITAYYAAEHPGVDFVGVDISPIGLRLARDRSLGQGRKNLDFVLSDLERMALRPGALDVVYCQSVLEHVTDWKETIAEFYRILRPGGVLFLETPNGGWRGTAWGAIASAARYVLRLNRAQRVDSSFNLTGTGSNRERSHSTDFDVWEIPSDVLVRQLRRSGFRIEYFSTNRERLFSRERYATGSGFFRLIVRAFVRVPLFPFVHMGGQIVIRARRGNQ